MTLEQTIKRYEGLKFPEGFNDAGNKTFKEVYETMKAFVFFTRHWQETTGLFKKWAEYVKARDKLDNVSSPDLKRSGGIPIIELPVAESWRSWVVCRRYTWNTEPGTVV